ncbi:MFS transporter [bacterium]|nr:MFS transporter [bacterium]
MNTMPDDEHRTPDEEKQPYLPPEEETHADKAAEEAATPPTIPADVDEDTLTLPQTFKILLRSTQSFWMVNIVNVADGVAYFGVLTLMTLFITNNVGFSESTAGLAVSMFTGLVTLTMLIGGFVSDRVGVRHAFTISLGMLLVGRIMFVETASLTDGIATMLWTSIIVMALAEGIIQPALYAGVKEFTDPRTHTIGYSVLYSIMNLGILIGEFSSPFIREVSGIEGVYWTFIGVTGVALLINFFGFTKKVENRDRVVHVEKKKPTEPGATKTFWEKVRTLPFLDARFLFFIFILLPVRTLFAHQWLTLPQYIERCFPEAVFARYEWFQAANPFIIIVFVPLFAALTRKVSVLKMMIIGTTVSALTTFILVPGPNFYTLIFYVVVFSFGEALWSSRFLEYVAHMAPAGRVGAYMGLAGIPWFFAKATTGLYSGTMIEIFIPKGVPQDQLNSETMWLFYAFIACITPVGLILTRGWLRKGIKN